jgi:hypothetical protein
MAVPYAAREAYDPRGSRIADLILAAGNARARGAQQGGQIMGNMIGSLGEIASGAVQQYGADKEKRARELFDKQQDQKLFARLSEGNGDIDPREVIATVGLERGSKILPGLVAFHELGMNQAKDAREAAVRAWDGLKAIKDEGVRSSLYRPLLQQVIKAGIVPPELGHQVPDLTPETFDMVDSFVGQLRPKQADQRGQVVGRALVGADGKVIYRDPDPPKEPVSSRPMVVSPGSVVIDPATGKPIYTAPRAPAEPKTGRAVTAGDAGRIAELETSLDDLETLGASIGKTGTVLKIGAMIPKAVTDLTGWGEEAKQRQAVIDRVKQVIVKALEGGVLRKEDENKYEKILPTIGDTPAVAQSKIEGLKQAIALRRQREIEARADAGYDVSKFEQRTRPAAAPAASGPKVGEKRVINGTPAFWDGKGWVAQ